MNPKEIAATRTALQNKIDAKEQLSADDLDLARELGCKNLPRETKREMFCRRFFSQMVVKNGKVEVPDYRKVMADIPMTDKERISANDAWGRMLPIILTEVARLAKSK